VKRHPIVHPHDVLDDLYHAQRSPPDDTKPDFSPPDGVLQYRASAVLPQMHADVSAGRRTVRGVDPDAQLWLVRGRLEARRRARPQQVQCDIER